MSLHHQIRRLIAPLAATALVAGATAASAPGAQAEALYSLETQCSLGSAPAVACTVEAVEEDGATAYRHTIGKRTITIRIAEDPTTTTWMEGTDGEPKALSTAGAQFSSNTICFNGRDLCVVNPNYLNSIQEERPDALEGRDLVRVIFGTDGRVALTCYDEACEEVNW